MNLKLPWDGHSQHGAYLQVRGFRNHPSDAPGTVGIADLHRITLGQQMQHATAPPFPAMLRWCRKLVIGGWSLL